MASGQNDNTPSSTRSSSTPSPGLLAPSPSPSLRPAANPLLSTNKLRTRPRSGSLPMAPYSNTSSSLSSTSLSPISLSGSSSNLVHGNAPVTSSSLRVEVLPDPDDDDPAPLSASVTAASATTGPSGSGSPSSSGTVTGGFPARIRHVSSHSSFASTGSPRSGRSRSGSITTPRPANLALLTQPPPSSSPAPASAAATSPSPSPSPSSTSIASLSARRPRSGSAAGATVSTVANHSLLQQKGVSHDANGDNNNGGTHDDEVDDDLASAQLSLNVDKGPPQSTETWEPVIPDIQVHDEDAVQATPGQVGSLQQDDEEQHLMDAFEVLDLIIPDVSEASAAAEAAEQQELERQQQELQQRQDQAAAAGTPPAAIDAESFASKRRSTVGATDYLAMSTLGLGAGLVPPVIQMAARPSVSPPSSPAACIPLGNAKSIPAPILATTSGTLTTASSTTTPHSPSIAPASTTTTAITSPPTTTGTIPLPTSALSIPTAASAQTSSITTAPSSRRGSMDISANAAALAARFRLPFSSRAFHASSASQDQEATAAAAAAAAAAQPSLSATGTFQSREGFLGISNPMQRISGDGTTGRSSFFDYRLSNLLQFGSSSIAPSVRSLDGRRGSTDVGGGHGSSQGGGRDFMEQELYEVEFNKKPDQAEEERRRRQKTVWGRIKNLWPTGLPGKDLDPRTRKPRYKFPSNNIKTTKYTPLTFVPVNLLFQFKRFYNIYFLFAAIFVVAEPSLSPVTNILPLALVLTITAIKDGLEDYRRHKQDKRSNSLPCTIVRDGQLISVQSKDIRPGDVLKIHKNDKVPADVVLLSTSMDEGACFVETSELDGETNLKRKAALGLTMDMTSVEQISALKGIITTEMPNERLSRLDGKIRVQLDGRALCDQDGPENEKTLERLLTRSSMASRQEPVVVVSLDEEEKKSETSKGGSFHREDSCNSLQSIESGESSSKSARSTATRSMSRSAAAVLAEGGVLDETGPVTMTNVILRGCWLKNTDWVYGVVLYAGVDTKMMRNLKKTGLKFSTMEVKLNRMIVWIFVFNAFLLVGSLCFAYVGQRAASINYPNAWYLSIEGEEFGETPSSVRLFVGQMMNFYVIYTFVIPISVFISVEVSRVVQALWMIWDEEMRSYTDMPLSQAELEEIAMEQGDQVAQEMESVGLMAKLKKAKKDKKKKKMMASSDIDPLAKKTKGGFRRLNPLNLIKLHKKKAKKPKNWTRMHVRNSNLNEDLGSVEYIFSDKTGTLTRNVMKLSKWHIGGRTFHEMQQPGSLGDRMRDPAISDEEYDLLMAFCRNIVVCHAVIPCEDSKTGELLYEAQSPDESALLEALRDNGVVLKAKTKDSVTVEIFGLITETYTVLKVLEFTSDRKRMSVIIDTPQGIQLFCKGADNVILSRADIVENEPAYLRHLDATVRRFSIAGLRTLMLAWRPLTLEEYRAFEEEYSAAECSLVDREDEIQNACERIESRLRLLGCTAIEDRLQDQVPETIEYLMDADIKIWLLTGDKQETAINIGISSRLISTSMKILVLNVKVERDCRLVLEHFVERIKDREREDEMWARGAYGNKERPQRERYALVVNGESLAFVLGNEIFEEMFLKIGTNCHSVICNRVTPLQKALVVKLVRKRLHKVTLAIGDGANDISMIQAAHVGVGIEGMEGAQAARSSDFSFKQFKNLRRLLTIHGRYSYLRMSKIIFFSFYKSICLITVQFWFGFLSGWSGQALYDEYFLTLWNIVFTAMLPIAAATFEKDVDEDKIAQYPMLYKPVKDGIYWNTRTVIGWGLASFWHSGWLFLAIYGVLTMAGGQVVDWDSNVFDLPMINWFAGALVVVTVTLKMMLMINHWTPPVMTALIVSMAGFCIVWIGLEVVNMLQHGVFGALHSTPLYYFSLLVIPVGALLPDYVLAYVLHQFWPSDANIIQEDQYLDRMRVKAKTSKMMQEDEIGLHNLEDGTRVVEDPRVARDAEDVAAAADDDDAQGQGWWWRMIGLKNSSLKDGSLFGSTSNIHQSNSNSGSGSMRWSRSRGDTGTATAAADLVPTTVVAEIPGSTPVVEMPRQRVITAEPEELEEQDSDDVDEREEQVTRNAQLKA
ncbi:hypothetical protein BGZ73_003563 [Actinomortierella ambigua]|nr:hypothetical protein BGZ73_003563 [Actinomortierella ambigua]